SVSLLLGQGGGLLGAATSFDVANSPRAVALADLNGDGSLDLQVAVVTENIVEVLLGEAGGQLGASTAYGVGIDPTALAPGDLDGDGKLDLAVADINSNAISVLLNLLPDPSPWTDLGGGLSGLSGLPALEGTGT